MKEELQTGSEQLNVETERLRQKTEQTEFLETKADEIVEFYEQIKEMSRSLDPLETFLIFVEAMSRYFSFDGVKQITSGEGGALVTSDPEVIRRARDARLLAVENDTDRRVENQRSWDFDVTNQGYRFHMSNIMAAIGRVQLHRLWPEFAPRLNSLAP